MNEQQALWHEKNEYLDTYCEQVSAFEFYRDIFPEGSFERNGHYEDNKPNGIAMEIGKDGKVKRYTVTDELTQLTDLQGCQFAIVSPISYFGFQRKGSNARYAYAYAFDIDGVGMPQLRDILFQMKNDVIPTATYIVNSGTGMHLYYVFEEPIPLYPQNQKYLKELKYALTRRLWNDYTSAVKERQVQGIMQGFRVVGTQSKLGEDYPVLAFGHGGRITTDRLFSYIPVGSGEIEKINSTLKPRMTLQEARKKYPEWYDKKVVRRERNGRWTIKRALYDWWLDRIKNEIKVGHRFFAIMTLAIYAKKCCIEYDELKRDAFSLFDMYEEMTADDVNHFTTDDIICALELYNENYVTFPRDDIGKLAGLQMPVNKRNYRKQDIHLKISRSTRDILHPNGEWRIGNGRPSAELAVIEYRRSHPNSNKAEVIRGTGLSRSTVYKYWNK